MSNTRQHRAQRGVTEQGVVSDQDFYQPPFCVGSNIRQIECPSCADPNPNVNTFDVTTLSVPTCIACPRKLAHPCECCEIQPQTSAVGQTDSNDNLLK
eukprot:3517946-Amphidinium_carterae.1